MLSLDNVFDEHELRAWAQRCVKALDTPAQEISFAVERRSTDWRSPSPTSTES